MCQTKILIIENSTDCTEKISGVLSESTDMYKIECSKYIETALIQLKEKTYDLILLELNSSIENNEALFEKIYRTAKGVPIIVLVNIIDKKTVSFLLKRSFWDFLYKEKLSFNILSSAIKYIVENNKKNKKLQLDEKIYQKIADQFETNLFVADKEGIIKYANAAFAKLYEMSINEVTGRSLEFQFVTGKKIEIQIETRNNEIHFLEITVTNSVWENEEHFFVSIANITTNKQNEKWQILENNILEVFESSRNAKNCTSEVMFLMQKALDIESVAIKLREGNNYNLFTSSGFCATFFNKENNLCNCFMSGNSMHDQDGNPIPECLSKYYPFKDSSIFNFSITKKFSYWSNHLNERANTNYSSGNNNISLCKCRIEGYNSLALIPIKAGNEIIGLLQLNGKRENMFSDKIIQNIENICSKFGPKIIIKLAEDTLAIKYGKSKKNKTVKSSIYQGIYKKLPQLLTVF